MSTHAVIRFWESTTDEHPIGLYLHWDGDEYAEAVAVALRVTRGRWNDEEYATRMAIQSILESYGIQSQDLGAGLFVGTQDHGEGHRALNVTWGSQVVWNGDQRIGFEEFINNEWKALQG